ncbi:MAG TPA: hypothetical protein VMU49_03275 [Candidatus Acidoferrales bacterium]|nr:hypothetical protein [Candidatus Acidoferrales bacterium]
MIVSTQRPAHGGAVVAHHEGRVVLVHRALPGEIVEAELRGRRGGVSYASAVGVLSQSPDRVPPRCPHFGICGGCSWQHAAYPAQLQYKMEVVQDAWHGAGLRLPPDTPISGMADPWRYRIRGEFEAIGGGADLEFGFHRLRSHQTFPITTCPIHDLRIERTLFAFRDAGRESGEEDIQNILLTVEPTGPGVLWRIRRRGRSRPDQDQKLAQAASLRVPDLTLLDDSIGLDFWDLRFRVRSETFVQTNYKQMLVLYQAALEMLDAGPSAAVLDLYSGIGTISVAAARTARAVTGVEENPGAAQLSLLSARINSSVNLRALSGRVESVLGGIRLGEYQLGILDPPRAGCDPQAIAELLRLGLDRLVYISCEPSTHARDIAHLVRGGYRVRRAALVDMFPHTYHIESVALLERG